jgi:hypothetical protein
MLAAHDATAAHRRPPQDTVENSAEAENLVARPELAPTVANLSQQLHAGWRAARAVGAASS